jgi:hypothetical protein
MSEPELSSVSANYYQDIWGYTPPSNTSSDCQSKKNSYNTKFTDATNALHVLRDPASDCLPNDVKYKEEIEALQRDKNTLIRQYNEQKDVFDTFVSSVDVLQNARGPIDKFMDDLEEKKKALEKEHYELQQSIRAGRRRFLDNDPQGGVTSILGLNTADDKILLAFWICFIFGIATILTLILIRYGDILQLITIQQKVAVFTVVILLCIGIAYAFIRRFA